MECEEPVEDTVYLERKKGENKLTQRYPLKETTARGFSLGFLLY